MTRTWSRSAAGALVAALLLIAAGASASTRYDPRLRFRTISTPRFDIHFHQGEEAVARRLASFIEEAAAEVDATLGPPAGRVQVILVDQDDLANGWATPLPYNTIEITAAAPAAESLIGNASDWLRLVFIHEYTHVAHLSRAGGWIGSLRRVFGRAPALFPNLFQPVWGIEGLATWQESAATGQGRVPAGDFRLLLQRAAAAGRFEPLDRASGGNVDWPSGTTPYLYGAYFHQYLAERYGAASLRTLADETARRLPYLGSRAYRKVYGRSLGALWRDFRTATAEDSGEAGLAAARLTRHGFIVSAPRYAPDGRLFYSVSNPRGFPALMELRAPGAVPREVAPRFLGNRIAIAGGELIVDELDLVRSVGLRSDLYGVNPENGRRRRITRAARALDPDVSGAGIGVCTVQMADRRALATFAVVPPGGAGAPEVLISEAFTDFSSPRWSPDGRSIAAERRRLGGPSEIVLVDPGSRHVRVLASLPGGRSAAPAWMPDGSHVLFSSAVGEEPFRIFRVDPVGGEVERLEGTGSNARSPDVSPDGRTLAFVGYTAAGFDVFALPLADARWSRVAPAPDGESAPAVPAAPPLETRVYSPWPTLAPRAWTPIVESDSGEILIGAAAASADVLGRHLYSGQAAWGGRSRPDWHIGYAYDRWRPTVFAAVSEDADPWRGGEWRTRQADLGMVLRFARVRAVQATFASVHVAEDEILCEPCVPAVDHRTRTTAVRAGWSFSSAREFGYSVSPEEGGRVAFTAEVPRRALGSDGNGVALTADVRKYLRAGPRHTIIAVRGAAAGSWGDQQRLFSASGHGPDLAGFEFGVGAVGLLRGFGEDQVTGTRAAVGNLDVRVPLARVDRGLGTVPVFLRSIHGAVFLDAGHAWQDAPRWQDLRLAIGAEISADTVVGFALPLTLTGGGAWRHDPAGAARGFVAFGRIGRAF